MRRRLRRGKAVFMILGITAIVMFMAATTASAFFDEIFKGAAKSVVEDAAKKAVEKAAQGGVEDASKNAPPVNTVVAQTPPAVDPSECRKGQLVNPYFLMLNANLLNEKTADMGDAKCVSIAQLKKFNERYIKQK